MSLERLCGYPPRPGTGKVRSPWKRWVPCLTGGTQLAMRQRRGNTIVFKHLHPLEAFQMNGWPLEAWNQDKPGHGVCKHPLQHKPGTPGHTPLKKLRHMAGNMWSAYHYVPVMMSALGAYDWSGVRLVDDLKAAKKASAHEHECSSDDADESGVDGP